MGFRGWDLPLKLIPPALTKSERRSTGADALQIESTGAACHHPQRADVERMKNVNRAAWYRKIWPVQTHTSGASHHSLNIQRYCVTGG